MSVQIVLNLSDLTEAELIAKATTIGTNMANPANAALVTGSPYTGAEVTTKTTTFSGKRQDGVNLKQAMKTNTTQKNVAQDDLEAALTSLRKHFESKPTLTPADAQALGFDLRAPDSPPLIVAPEDLTVTFGDVSGSNAAQWEPVDGASLYLLQYRLANTPGAPWITGYSNTASDCRVTGLTPGALYEFQVLAMFHGVDNPGPPSSVVEHRAA